MTGGYKSAPSGINAADCIESTSERVKTGDFCTVKSAIDLIALAEMGENNRRRKGKQGIGLNLEMHRESLVSMADKLYNCSVVDFSVRNIEREREARGGVEENRKSKNVFQFAVERM